LIRIVIDWHKNAVAGTLTAVPELVIPPELSGAGAEVISRAQFVTCCPVLPLPYGCFTVVLCALSQAAKRGAVLDLTKRKCCASRLSDTPPILFHITVLQQRHRQPKWKAKVKWIFWVWVPQLVERQTNSQR